MQIYIKFVSINNIFDINFVFKFIIFVSYNRVLFCVVKWSFGTEHFVRYNRVFVITECSL